MKYVNVNEIAAKWNLSERSVRNYCAHGKIPGVILDGKTWKIPEDAVKPVRKKRAEKIANDLLTRLKMEKEAGIPGGIYHKVQIELTYNSNHMEDRVGNYLFEFSHVCHPPSSELQTEPLPSQVCIQTTLPHN